MTESINLIIGGVYYSLRSKDIEKHSDSYFAHILNDQWNSNKSAPVQLDRDSNMFRYVQHFMYTGELDPTVEPIEDFEQLLMLKTEADFFNLQKMVELCDQRIKSIIQAWCDKDIHTEALFHPFECVHDSRELSTDPLVRILAPFRPPGIATCRLDNRWDKMEFKSETELLEHFYLERNKFLEGEFHHCKKIYLIDDDTCWSLWNYLHVWPLGSKQQLYKSPETFTPGSPKSYVYPAGAYCRERVIPTKGYVLGTYLYIFKSTFTGGTVTATVNGTSVSISKPGECLALIPGASYSVEMVTSGVLILVESVAKLSDEYSVDCTWHADTVEWIQHKKLPQNTADKHISTSTQRNITRCINHDLLLYNNVVICLAQYYPVSFSCDGQKVYGTDPDTLRDADAELYALLAANYKVQLVTMLVEGRGKDTWTTQACILDDVFTPNQDSAKHQFNEGEKYKVIAPIFGRGDPFRITKRLSCWVARWGTILTGIVVSKKL